MNKSKTSLFLMELIIVILFFSIASAVCVQLFIKAHEIDTATDKSSHANVIIQNLSECYYGTDADLNSINSVYTGSKHLDCSIYLTYDQDWNCTDNSSEVSYIAVLSDNSATGSVESDNDNVTSGLMKEAIITVYECDEAFPSEDFMNDKYLQECHIIEQQTLKHYIQYRKEAY